MRGKWSNLHLPRDYWWLWVGQVLARTGTLAPAFLVLYLQLSRDANSTTTSFLVALFGAGLVAAGLLGGAIGDRIGHRKTILVAQPIAIATAVAMLYTTNLIGLGVLVFLAGFLSSVDRPAGAAIVLSLVGKKRFSGAYGLYLMGFNVGLTASPVFAGILLDLYADGLFILWAVSGLAFFGCVLNVSPRRDTTPESNLEKPDGIPFWNSLLAPYRDPRVCFFLVLCFAVALVYLQINSTLPLHMASEGISGTTIGLIFAVNAVLSIILLPLVPGLADRLREVTPLVIAAALIAVGFGLNAFASNVPGFVVALLVWTLGEVLWAPMSAKFLTDRAPEGQVSSFQSSFFLAWNSALMVGGPIGIVVAEGLGYQFLWLLAFSVGALAVIGFILLKARIAMASDYMPGNSVNHPAPTYSINDVKER
ncbi:MAG: MFS transporter [Brachybacterium faecium]|nr:MAG: MFS transporter [Brachybacterium faecium]